jgi:hypothetical protein
MLLDEHYANPTPTSFAAANDDLRRAVEKRTRLFLQGAFTVHPIQFHEQNIRGRKCFDIDEVRGGPLISFTPPACYVDGGVTRLNTGILSYQRAYQNLATGEWEPPSRDVVVAFRNIVAALKKNCLKKDPDTGAWIGRDATTMLLGGVATIEAKGIRSRKQTRIH